MSVYRPTGQQSLMTYEDVGLSPVEVHSSCPPPTNPFLLVFCLPLHFPTSLRNGGGERCSRGLATHSLTNDLTYPMYIRM